MITETHPDALKQGFMTALKQTNQTISDIEILLTYFCEICWGLENEQQECYEKLRDFMRSLPPHLVMRFIPNLINKSKNFPKLVYLAEEMFNDLQDFEKKTIKIPMIDWTIDDSYTYICQGEYLYRIRQGLKAWQNGAGYARPSKALDFICFEKVIDMIIVSGSSTLMYLPGWSDDPY